MSCSHLAHAQWPRNDTDDMTDVSWEKASYLTTSILPLAEISPLHPPGRLHPIRASFFVEFAICFRQHTVFPVSV